MQGLQANHLVSSAADVYKASLMLGLQDLCVPLVVYLSWVSVCPVISDESLYYTSFKLSSQCKKSLQVQT